MGQCRWLTPCPGVQRYGGCHTIASKREREFNGRKAGVRRQRLGQLFLGLRQGAGILHAGALQGVRIPGATGDEMGDSMVYDYSGAFEPGDSRNRCASSSDRLSICAKSRLISSCSTCTAWR